MNDYKKFGGYTGEWAEGTGGGSTTGTAITFLLIGAVVGAAVALLFSPVKGGRCAVPSAAVIARPWTASPSARKICASVAAIFWGLIGEAKLNCNSAEAKTKNLPLISLIFTDFQ